MIIFGYSIHDSKSEVFHAPFFARLDTEAERMVRAAMEDPESMLLKYAGDFALYQVCMFDDESGKVTEINPRLVRQLAVYLD